MSRMRYSAKVIVYRLRPAGAGLSQGQTYYRWPKADGGRKSDQAKGLKELERLQQRCIEPAPGDSIPLEYARTGGVERWIHTPLAVRYASNV